MTLSVDSKGDTGPLKLEASLDPIAPWGSCHGGLPYDYEQRPEGAVCHCGGCQKQAWRHDGTTYSEQLGEGERWVHIEQLQQLGLVK